MSPTQALLWKEWTEHRWKLAFGTVMLASFAGALFAWGGISNREVILFVPFLGCLVLSFLNAMGTFAEEHSEGTALFLATRPIETGWIFLGKWLIGWINIMVPLMACGLTLYIWFGASPTSSSVMRDLFHGTLVMAWIATMLYSLSCCVTLRRAGPAVVGLTGLFWLGVMLLHLILSDQLFPHKTDTTPSLLQALVFFVNPITVLALADPPLGFKNAPWFFFIVGIVEQGILLAVILSIGLRNWKRSV